jgi:hypothetical protein
VPATQAAHWTSAVVLQADTMRFPAEHVPQEAQAAALVVVE